MKASRKLVMLAVRIAADAPQYTKASSHLHDRAMVKRSLIDDLRHELDLLGMGDDWRTLHDVVRAEDRQPRAS